MLEWNQVETVQRMLANDISQREIARLTGISRDTIRRIFKGEWQPRPEPVAAPFVLTHSVGRCPTCGGRVRLPCLACRIRRPDQKAVVASH